MTKLVAVALVALPLTVKGQESGPQAPEPPLRSRAPESGDVSEPLPSGSGSERNKAYVAFAIGGGGDAWVRGSDPHSFRERGGSTMLALDAEAGRTLSPRLLLGVRYSIITFWWSSDTVPAGLWSLDAVTTYFPWKRGAFVRGGLGFGSGSEGGAFEVTATAGYAFPARGRFNLTADLEGTTRLHGNEAVNRIDLWRFALGFGWY